VGKGNKMKGLHDMKKKKMKRHGKRQQDLTVKRAGRGERKAVEGVPLWLKEMWRV